MKLVSRLYEKSFLIIHTAFILCWLTNLAYTDSMFSIYVMCGIIGVFALCSNYFRRPILDKWSVLTFLGVSVIFAFLVILANYPLFSPLSDPLKLFDMGCTFLGGIVLAFDVLVCVFDRLPYDSLPADSASQLSIRRLYFLFFLSLASVCLIYLFFVQYPGIMTNDSYTQVHQILSGKYTNHHPFWHTMIIKVCYLIGSALSDNINACATVYAVLQILVMAACFSYSLITICQMKIPTRMVYMAWFVYALMPYNIAFSVCMNKDYLFSYAVLAFIVAFYRILKNIGCSRKLNYVVFAISGLCCCVLRSNGIYAFAGSTFVFALFLFREHKKLLLTMTSVLVFGWIMTNPFISGLNIPQPDLVESLSIPVQQVARVIYDGCDISEEDRTLIDQVVDIDEIPVLYTDWLSDPVKDEIRSKNNSYFEENRGEYFRLWLRLGMKYPGEYVKAWVDQTKGYWNGGYDYFVYALGIGTNDLGFTDGANNNIIAKIVNLIFKFCRGAIFMEPFESIGLHVWLISILFVVNWLKGRREMLLSVLPLMIVCTLLIATPVYAAFLYAYPVFTTYPFILASSVSCRESS